MSKRKKQATKSTNGAQHDDYDEERDESESGDEEVLIDTDLLRWVQRIPLGADHLIVLATSLGGSDVLLQDRSAQEAKREPEQLTIAISNACERWARSERKKVRFRACWQRGDKTLSTHSWELGDSEVPSHELDGSVQSFLIEQQRQQHQTHKLHLEGFEMVQESWRSLLGLQNKRIEALERDNAELRDRLRKLDDVQSEIAAEHARAEVEDRGRSLEILEKRLLPVVQAFALKQAQQAQPQPQPQPPQPQPIQNA